MANKYANEITAALSKLDPQNNEHWTDDGLPVTRVVQTLANEPGIKRSDINEVAPGFSRTSADPVEATGTGEPAAPEVSASVEGAGLGEKATFQTAFEEAEKALAQAKDVRIAAQRAELEAQKHRDKALTALNAAFPPLTHAQNIKQYINHEQAQRAERFGPGSQLDAAMSARRSRGWSRPKIGQMVAR